MRQRGDYRLAPSSVEITLWAIQRRTPITVDDIMARWVVAKCTAYRWVHVLNDARGQAERLFHRPVQTSGYRVPVQREVHAS